MVQSASCLAYRNLGAVILQFIPATKALCAFRSRFSPSTVAAEANRSTRFPKRYAGSCSPLVTLSRAACAISGSVVRVRYNKSRCQSMSSRFILDTPRWSKYTTASPGSTSCKARATSLSSWPALLAMFTVLARNSCHRFFVSSNTGQDLIASFLEGLTASSLWNREPGSSSVLDPVSEGAAPPSLRPLRPAPRTAVSYLAVSLGVG